MISNSLEWAALEQDLIHKANNLSYARDIKRLIENVGIEINELSKAEVDARRGKKYKAEELLIKVNNDIQLLEEFLLIAALLG